MHIHIQNDALDVRQGESEIVVKYSLEEPILEIDSDIMTFTGAMDYNFNGYDLTEFIYWGFRGNETTVKFLAQFPCPMIETWGHDNKITYLKINGEEYGELK